MMSRKNWIMLALLLMIPGAAGLGWGVQSQRASQTQTAAAAKAISDAPSADEYLGMYEQWSQLTAAQKGENPWGQGQYGGPEIQKRLREDQALRLAADLLDLDAGLKKIWNDRLRDCKVVMSRYCIGSCDEVVRCHRQSRVITLRQQSRIQCERNRS